MPGTRGPWDEATEIRAIRLLSTHKEAVRPNGRLRFQVLSSDSSKTYEVVVDQDGWSCSCPSWEDRRVPCSHIVETVIWLDPNRPAIGVDDVPRVRPTYRERDHVAYDRARQLEHQIFDRYLWDLLGPITDPVLHRGKRGRPAIPLRTQILVAVRKVHLKEDSRDAHGLLVALNQDGKGILPRVPNYSLPSRFFNRPDATEILIDLIERSGLVLRDIEDAGTVAIDSSGFSTSTMGAYFTEKYAPERRHQFVKAHLAVGAKTHIVLAVRVTDEHGADSPQFIPLLGRVAELGHTPDRVTADKAYLSRANLEAAGALGVDPFVPFKVNNRGLSKGSPMWNRKFHEFQLRRDEFDAAYHKRSNVESVFSAIKRTLNENLLSRTTLAKFNELLAKILAYNICVVIRQAELHGFDAGATSFIPKLPSPTTSAGVAS
jgi:transposase